MYDVAFTRAILREWESLGGTPERRVLGWKLVHPNYLPLYGVTFVQTKPGSDNLDFRYFQSIRIKDIDEWKAIFQQIAGNFELDYASNKDVRAYPRTNDIGVMRQFLQISLAYWTS